MNANSNCSGETLSGKRGEADEEEEMKTSKKYVEAKSEKL